MPSLDAFLAFGKAFDLHNNPVFLITFILLSYRRLVNQYLAPTFGSTVLTVLIAAACAQLAPFVSSAMSVQLPPSSPSVPNTDYADEPDLSAGAPTTSDAAAATTAVTAAGVEDAIRLLHGAIAHFIGS